MISLRGPAAPTKPHHLPNARSSYSLADCSTTFEECDLTYMSSRVKSPVTNRPYAAYGLGAKRKLFGLARETHYRQSFFEEAPRIKTFSGLPVHKIAHRPCARKSDNHG